MSLISASAGAALKATNAVISTIAATTILFSMFLIM
jgi:hypothetical protein